MWGMIVAVIAFAAAAIYSNASSTVTNTPVIDY
jgi:hypothetical protein